MHIHAVSQQVAAVVAIEDNAGAVQQRDVAVDLDAGKAVVSGKTLPEDAVLTAAVTEAGYEVVDIK